MITASWLDWTGESTERKRDIATLYNVLFLNKFISAAEPKMHVVDIPFADSVVDLTGQYGRTKYNNREVLMFCEITGDATEQMNKYKSIVNDCHCKFKRVVFSDDPSYFWHGKCYVSAMEDHGTSSGVTIKMDAFPYKGTYNQPLHVASAGTSLIESISITTGLGWIDVITPNAHCDVFENGYYREVQTKDGYTVGEMHESTFTGGIQNKYSNSVKTAFRLVKGAL